MKLNIIHPGKDSLGVLNKSIDNYEEIYRSPHVGNVNAKELGLVLGLSAMGADVQLELVDTIRAKDSYSYPRVAMVGLNRVVLTSNKSSGRIVGGCETKKGALEELAKLGVTLSSPTENLKQLHIESLRQVMPDSVHATPSTEFFARLPREVYTTLLRESSKILDRPLRYVSATGRIDVLPEGMGVEDIYGVNSSETGAIPSLEAMMAIEVVKKLLENGVQDSQLVHVAGPDMIEYTKSDDIMRPVEAIVNRVLSSMGEQTNVNFDYIVPCMSQTLDSKDFDTTIDVSVQSQYDLIVSRQAVG